MRILAAELGCDPSAVFEHFPKKPLASGSVAQVYKARLRKEVVAVCSALARPRRLDLNEAERSTSPSRFDTPTS